MTTFSLFPSTSTPLASVLDEAREKRKCKDYEAAIKLFQKVMQTAQETGEDKDAGSTEELPDLEKTRLQEQSIYGLAETYAQIGKAEELRTLILDCRPFFVCLPKAKTAKIVRTLIDLVLKIPNTGNLLLDLCLECIEWCRREKRTFLRHRIETRLALLYHQQGRLQNGLDLVAELLREVKKLDDKLLLVEIHLIESKLYWTIRNIAKSKAALTAARTNSNAIHCPPLLQGDIDLQGGILHAQESDFKTAFSYFYEAFEAFSTAGSSSSSAGLHASQPGVVTDDPRALQSLKYLMLAKIMCGSPDDVTSILSGKHGLKHVGAPGLEALRAIAKCHKERSLKMFQDTLELHKEHLNSDPVLKHHISDLYETLLEQNILRILEPFSRVEVEHVAKLIDLPHTTVQKKLGEMVLDCKLQGTLDQGVGVLILFDQPPLPAMYEDVRSTLKHMSEVVETLFEKAQQVVRNDTVFHANGSGDKKAVIA